MWEFAFPWMQSFSKIGWSSLIDANSGEKFKYYLFKVEKCTILHYCKNLLVQNTLQLVRRHKKLMSKLITINYSYSTLQIQNFKLHFLFLNCPQYSRFLKLRQLFWRRRGGGSRRQGISISRSMPTYFRASAWLYLKRQETGMTPAHRGENEHNHPLTSVGAEKRTHIQGPSCASFTASSHSSTVCPRALSHLLWVVPSKWQHTGPSLWQLRTQRRNFWLGRTFSHRIELDNHLTTFRKVFNSLSVYPKV